SLDERHSHRDEGGAVAIVQVEVVVRGAATFFDLQTGPGVKRFFTGAANPELSLPQLEHFDLPLLHHPCSTLDPMDLKAAGRGQRSARALDFRDEQGDLGRATERLFARHASSPRKTTSLATSDGRVRAIL